MKLLSAFKEYGYSNVIGPGVYDIHSPRVPSEQEIKERISAMLELIPPHMLFINPVCIIVYYLYGSTLIIILTGLWS